MESLLTTKPKNREIEQLQMQLKMKTDKSEHKIQSLEAKNQALKQKLFQEDEQLQHGIKENMHRREESLVTSGSKEENEVVLGKV